jgi:CRISPR-associated protein Csy2
MNDLSGLILLPRLRVQNANAISGPLSWGFPSPTAFTGFVHALERKLAGQLSDGFAGVGIVCHHFEPQVSGSGYNTVTFNLKRMMVMSRKECDQLSKDGTPPAFVEEGRAHLEISLLIGVRDYFSDAEGQYLAEDLQHAAYGMRLAGGSPLYRPGKRYAASWHPVAGNVADDTATFRKLRRRLLPGFALVQRDDLLKAHLAEMRLAAPASTALDALLDLSRLNFEPVVTPASEAGKPETVDWQIRKKPGWLVPLPIGYAGISDLYAPGQVANTRDASTPFRFVESLYSLGEWVSPHRLQCFEQLLWMQEADAENGIYRCRNRHAEFIAQDNTESQTSTQEQNHG